MPGPSSRRAWGDKWDRDEKHQKVRGKESCGVAVIYITTRFVLAWDISPTKDKYNTPAISLRLNNMVSLLVLNQWQLFATRVAYPRIFVRVES